MLRVSKLNSFQSALLTKLAGMSLVLVMSNYKICYLLLKLMFRLRDCNLRFCYYGLFLQKRTANSYLWKVWLEQRRRVSLP